MRRLGASAPAGSAAAGEGAMASNMAVTMVRIRKDDAHPPSAYAYTKPHTRQSKRAWLQGPNSAYYRILTTTIQQNRIVTPPVYVYTAHTAHTPYSRTAHTPYITIQHPSGCGCAVRACGSTRRMCGRMRAKANASLCHALPKEPRWDI